MALDETAFVHGSGRFGAPDAFWWTVGQRRYTQIGGLVNDGSWCGGLSMNLSNTAYSEVWNLGAKYTRCILV